MAWNKVVLSSAQIEEQHRLQDLEKQFEKLYIAAGGPENMALLFDNEYSNGSIGIYFSPDCNPHCAELIARFGGEECGPPPLSGVFVLDGDDEVLDLPKPA